MPAEAEDSDGISGEAVETVAPEKAYLERRKLLLDYCKAAPGKKENNRLPKKNDLDWPLVGIAFSGGGIRSATISLGMTEELARRGRLYGFDYMSTVSGGGYFGSFLRSLYVPEKLRGPEGDRNAYKAFSACADDDELKETFRFADRVFKISPSERRLPQGKECLKHPLRWLREHGRYLAPNGAGDYAVAATYLTRNWFATLFMMIVAMGSLIAIAQISAVALNPLLNWMSKMFGNESFLSSIAQRQVITPFFWPLLILLFCSFAIGAAYWITFRMRYNPDQSRRELNPLWERYFQRLVGGQLTKNGKLMSWASASMQFITAWYVHVLIFLASLGGLALLVKDGSPLGDWLRFSLEDPAGASDLALFIYYILMGLLGAALAIGFFAYGLVLLRSMKNQANFTAELRRLLVSWQTYVNIALATIAALCIIDIFTIYQLGKPAAGFGITDASSVWLLLIQPPLAYLVQKIPQWAGSKESWLMRFARERLMIIALILGVFLFACLTILVNLLVQSALWHGVPWQSDPDLPTAFTLLGVFLAMAIFTWFSRGFVNLSSLHALYSSRLSKAYMGASNRDRLRLHDNISGSAESFSADHIGVLRYQQAILPAPFHFINVTINETKTADKLVARDRKGRRGVIGIDGLTIDGAVNGWSELEDKVENLSVAQLCGISGAAASSGMGRKTTLGTSLLLTYANVRLGYWWDVGNADLKIGKAAANNQKSGVFDIDISGKKLKNKSTFGYLLCEMLGSYSLDNKRFYLSDGGHSENTGVLTLLEKGCKTILVADNGQDPEFEFADLETLIRTTRIDAGYEITIAKQLELEKFLYGKNRKRTRKTELDYFLNIHEDWRNAAREKGNAAHILLLRARKIIEAQKPGQKLASQDDRFILWFKPKLFDRIPPDIASYSSAHPDFPQQTTADQFFDEAQWESYRRIGFEMVNRLFRNPTIISEIPTIWYDQRQSES